MIHRMESLLDSIKSSHHSDGPALQALVLEYVGASLAERGHNERALRFYQRAVAAHPASIKQRMRLGTHLHNMNRLSEAMEVGLSIARDDPDSHVGFLLSGAAAYRAADYGRAQQLLAEALRLKPDNDTVRDLLERSRKESLHRVLDGASPSAITIGTKPPTNHASFLDYLRGFASRGALNGESFWKSHNKNQLVQNPENVARALFAQDLSATCRSAAFYKESVLPGGRIDLIVNILGAEFIVELKICGAGYSRSYAEGGFDQLRDYLRARDQTRGYLIVYDSRAAQDGDNRLPEMVELGDGMVAFCIQVDIRGKRQG